MRRLIALSLLLAPLAAAAPSQSGTFTWVETPDKFASTLSYDGKPVLQYVYPTLDLADAKTREATFKMFHHVYDPSGTRLVTKGVGGHFTHHRGLFYGFNKISYGDKACDIWHGTKDGYKSMSAYQEQVKVLAREATPAKGGHTVLIAWHGPDKAVFAEEERTLSVAAPKGDGLMIDFASKLSSKVDAPIKLDGDPQHAGFHFRADNEVDVAVEAAKKAKTPNPTYYLRPDGKGALGETRNWDAKKGGPVNLPWNAMSFVLGGKRYTALYIDHPGNPKEARYSERDYGRFGSYFEYSLTKEKPLTVRYRVWLKDGEMTGDEAAALAKAFVANNP